MSVGAPVVVLGHEFWEQEYGGDPGVLGRTVRIRNRDVTLLRGGETQTLQLADRVQLRETVRTHFGFDLPALETMRVPLVPEWT